DGYGGAELRRAIVRARVLLLTRKVHVEERTDPDEHVRYRMHEEGKGRGQTEEALIYCVCRARRRRGIIATRHGLALGPVDSIGEADARIKREEVAERYVRADTEARGKVLRSHLLDASTKIVELRVLIVGIDEPTD